MGPSAPDSPVGLTAALDEVGREVDAGGWVVAGALRASLVEVGPSVSGATRAV